MLPAFLGGGRAGRGGGPKPQRRDDSDGDANVAEERKNNNQRKGQQQNSVEYVAIHHTPLDPNYFEDEVLPNIKWNSGSQTTEFKVHEIVEDPGVNKFFYYVAVGSFAEAKALASNSGTYNLVMGLLNQDKLTLQRRVLDQIMSNPDEFVRRITICNDCELHLSELREKLEDATLSENDPKEMSFILFFHAVLLWYKGIAITTIVFDQWMTNGDSLFNIKSMFPALTSIFVTEKINISGDIMQYLAANGIRVLVGHPSAVRHVHDPPLLTAPILPDGWETPGMNEPGIRMSLSDYPPVQFDVRRLPVSEILVKLFEFGWGDFSNIGNLYRADSRFTVSVDLHGPGSALSRFDKYAKEVVNVGGTIQTDYSNVLIGQEQITGGQMEMFRGQFYAHPTSYQWMAIAPDMVAFVVEGVFQAGPDVLLGFSRSMVVAMWTEEATNKAAIVNDHILLRLPRT